MHIFNDVVIGSSSCGILDFKNEFLFITGHSENSNQVTKYGPEGDLEDLPQLLTGRTNHACAGYYQEDNFVIIVAGGINTCKYNNP